MVSFAAVPAAAGNPCVTLELSAPQECPSAATIEQTVMELVHTVPSTPLAARATIVKDGERYGVTVVTAAGERTFDGETCQAAADALSVILALAVDPNASTTQPATPPDLAPAPAPAAQPAPTPALPPPPPVPPVVAETKAREQPAAPRPEREPLTLGGSALAFFDTGLLPQIGVGPAVTVRLTTGPVSAELSGKFLLPNEATFEDDPTVGGDFRWIGGGLEGCLRVLPPLYTCFGVEVGELTGEGVGINQPFTRTATVVAFTGGAVGRWNFEGDFALEGRLGVAAPMDRPQFGLEGFGELHQPDAASFRFALGVAFQ